MSSEKQHQFTNKEKTMKTLKTTTAAITAAMALFATGAFAASVKIDSVTQRWPWNNKVDIKYTVNGAGSLTSFEYSKIIFTANVNGVEYTIDGARDVIASVKDGQHIVTWTNTPAGVKSDACKLSASLYRTTGDYMVIDLDTGAYAFDSLAEGDTATAIPTLSNARYNTDIWKTDRMVLRRIPRTANADATYSAGYPTGHSDFSTSNSARTWTTDKDYFIGVFMVTQHQYKKIVGSNPANAVNQVDRSGDSHWLRPVDQVKWNDLRASTASTTAIPTISSMTGSSFFQRLKCLTGNALAFDLPTEVMFEIAHRAGVTTAYYWGSSADKNKTVCYDNARLDGTARSVHVGSKTSNKWGLFDMSGNIFEWCRDDDGLANLADATDPWTPYYNSAANAQMHGGGTYGAWNDATKTKASYRESYSKSTAQNVRGFRVSVIMQ